MKFIKSFSIFEEKDMDLVFDKMSNFLTRRFKNENIFDYIIYWIGKIFQYKNFLFITKIELSEDTKDIKKIFLIVDEKYLDRTGLHTKEDIMKDYHITQYTWKEFTYKGSFEDVEKYMKIEDKKPNDKQLKELKIIIQNFKNK